MRREFCTAAGDVYLPEHRAQLLKVVPVKEGHTIDFFWQVCALLCGGALTHAAAAAAYTTMADVHVLAGCKGVSKLGESVTTALPPLDACKRV